MWTHARLYITDSHTLSHVKWLSIVIIQSSRTTVECLRPTEALSRDRSHVEDTDAKSDLMHDRVNQRLQSVCYTETAINYKSDLT